MSATTTVMTTAPTNLLHWIDQHKDSLQPPVCNALIHNSTLKTMVVGGPNVRTDYHLNATEEWFYQLKGDMVLRVVDGGRFKSVPIKEGEVFLLPGRTPHSPQRTAGSIGLVMERARDTNDGLRWYCKLAPQDVPISSATAIVADTVAHAEGCKRVVHERHFSCKDLVGQLKTAISDYYDNEDTRTCPCGRVDQKPQKALEVPAGVTDDGAATAGEGEYGQWGMGTARIGKGLRVPIPFSKWVVEDGVEGEGLTVTRAGEGYSSATNGETLIYAGKGTVDLQLPAEKVTLPEGTFILVPPSTGVQVSGDGRVVLVTAVH